MKVMKVISVLALFTTLVACNTFQGFGKDMQAGGKAISKAADDTKSGNTKKTNNN